MGINTLWIIIVLLAVVGFFWFKKQNLNKKNSSVGEKNTQKDKPYQCVEIKFNSNACQAVKVFKSQKFLTKDAPRLPISGCNNASSCVCKYVRYDDRRTESRREDYSSAKQMIIGGDFVSNNQDKRTRKDRRKPKKAST